MGSEMTAEMEATPRRSDVNFILERCIECLELKDNLEGYGK